MKYSAGKRALKILYSAVKWMMGKSMKLFHIYRMAKSSLEKHLYGFSSLENFGELRV